MDEVLVEEEETEADDASGSGESTGRPFGDGLSAAALPFGEGPSAAAVPAPTPSASELVFAAARAPGKGKAKGTSNGAPSGVKVLDISSRAPLQMSTPSTFHVGQPLYRTCVGNSWNGIPTACRCHDAAARNLPPSGVQRSLLLIPASFTLRRISPPIF